MKKRTKILLAVLGVFLIVASVLVIWQWNNIKSLAYYLMYSEGELSELAEENDKLIAEAMEKVPEVSLRELTEEEEELLISGEITESEAIQLILDQITISKLIEDHARAKEQADNAEEAGGESESGSPGSSSNLDALLARVYVLQSTYTGALAGLKQAAVAEYNALPEDQKTSSAKTSIGRKYLGQASSLEGQCDSAMSGLCSEISAALKAEGKDTSLVSDIKSAYANQKSITKAQYLSMYG